jgi:hypothetical protein
MNNMKFGQQILARQLRISSRRDVDLISVLLLAMFTAFMAYVARLNPVTHDAFHEMALVGLILRLCHPLYIMNGRLV